MKNIKVFLQSPWKNTDSPYYKYLRKKSPIEIKYANAENFKLIQDKNKLRINNWVKQRIKLLIGKLYPSMPNAHYTPNPEKYDLIHCAHCISKNKSPWVCDIEFVGQFWASGPYKDFQSGEKVLKYLQSDYCKKILAWTKWSEKGILKLFPEIQKKVEILYPAIPGQKRKKSSSGKINLLFIGRDFKMKGGGIALKIFDELTKKYDNVYATVISDVPEKILKKYELNSKTKIYGLMSHEKLSEEIYPNEDIFVYPTFSDTFGFAILEAQSFGLPVVVMKTRDTHTIGETVIDGKTGFIVENLKANAVNRVASEKIIEQIKKVVEKLINDKSMLKSMSKNCLKEIGKGKFSIEKRNKKLRKIYEEAINENGTGC